ncbi:MAG: Gfo/Idh/MocA family oxidoreductase [Pirellulaceae bacterium]|nr:Gfo/Idh/MocA family oxidoreductase [Pirellulaceae bacterium]
MAKVRIGLIGVGNISKLHAQGYALAPNAELFAVCDVNEERVQERKAAWGATKAYTNYHDLLDDSDVDAVEIITPHHLHAQIGLDALAAGKHVSMQKPMATTMAECDQLISASNASDQMFRTFENFQYYPPLVRAKELLDSGSIGEPLSMRIKTTIGTKQGWEIPYERWSWRFDPEKGGGGRIMLDYGSHVFAIAQFFMGDVEKVFSWISHQTIQHGWKIDSPAVVIWKYKDAAKYGSFEVIQSDEILVQSDHVPEDEWFEITGSRGFIWVNRCSSRLLDAPPVVMYRDGVTTNYSDMDTNWESTFIAGCNEFADCILAGRQARLTAEEGAKIVQMCRGIEQSARESREVLLDARVE